MGDGAEHFYNLAKSFVTWTRRPAESNRLDAELARLLLASTYAAVLNLPVGTQPEEPPVAVSDDSWNAVMTRFSRLPFRYYTTIIHPLAYPVEDQVVADVSDDLATVYRALEEGIALYELGLPDHAAWHWRFMFDANWGRRALGALGAIQAYLSLTPATPS
ncbi:MAG: hypothetical protein JWO56_1656 [Acidobacteria bacterium]|nr:hypothetical protein [Acidobacteriota bacterium]